MCIEKLPNPRKAQAKRIPKLYTSQLNMRLSDEQQQQMEVVEQSLLKCRTDEEAPVVIFISKVFASPFTSSETIDSGPRIARPVAEGATAEAASAANAHSAQRTERFIGFGRIFSGVLKRGASVHVLGPRYNPQNPEKHISVMTADEIYIMMGRGLEAIDRVPAGNIFGLAGVDDHILKTATLSSTPMCLPMLSVRFSQSIVRVAIEPKNPTEMPIFMEGLKKLNQSDASVDIYIQDSGEHVISAAGEMHLERCLTDLKELFAPIELLVSPPIVSFKETIIEPSKTIRCRTRGGVCQMSVSAKPLPEEIVEFLESNASLIKSTFRKNEKYKDTPQFHEFQRKVVDTFIKAGWSKEIDQIWSFGPKRCGPNILFNHSAISDTRFWKSICVTEEADLLTRFQEDEDEQSLLTAQSREITDHDQEEEAYNLTDDEHWKLSLIQSLDFSVINGFQLATGAGPLCEEPVRGVAFFVESLAIKRVPDEDLNKYGPFKGQVMPTFCQALRDAFHEGKPHLVEPYYSALLQVPTRWFGDATSVLIRRRSKIINEQFLEGTDHCQITASLPVTESFGFIPEIMQKTSGAARSQLQFSHWALLEEDPNWVPTTEEEKEEFGTNADARGDNVARLLVDDIRRRKGLHVEEKLVEHAEKQRTLSKKK